MKQTILISISIRPSEKDKLRKLAELNHLSMSSYISKMISDEYYRHAKELGVDDEFSIDSNN